MFKKYFKDIEKTLGEKNYSLFLQEKHRIADMITGELNFLNKKYKDRWDDLNAIMDDRSAGVAAYEKHAKAMEDHAKQVERYLDIQTKLLEKLINKDGTL